jgi:serine/threonine-protein kinase
MDDKSIKLDPTDYAAWSNLGETYNWSGTQHDKAVQAFQEAIKLGEAAHSKDRQDPVLLVLLANDYAAIGNSEKSLTLVSQALALAPDKPAIEYQAGEAYETLGHRASAIPLIAKAVATGYRSYEFHRNPLLASLQADPAFQKALQAEKRRKN